MWLSGGPRSTSSPEHWWSLSIRDKAWVDLWLTQLSRSSQFNVQTIAVKLELDIYLSN
jgi:hypothetical protein